MLEFQITFDRAAFAKDIDSAIQDDVRPAIADILNEAVLAAQEAVREGMKKGFDRPKPFTLAGVKVFPARANASDGTIDAVVFLTDTVSGYLDLEITPGTRRAGAPGTTKLGPLVPGPAAPLDSFGNLARGYVKKVLEEPDVAWVRLKPGYPPALVRHGKAGLEVLAVIATETHYNTVRLPFFQLAQDAVYDTIRRANGVS